MATHAHSTRTPLLPEIGARPPLLRSGSARIAGPVALPVLTMRSEEPPLPAEWLADLAAGREALALLRQRVADRIEHDLALLDALDGEPEVEDGHDAEMTAAEWTGRGAHRFNIGEAA